MRGLTTLTLLACAQTAHAQKVESRSDPVRVTVSGRVEFDAVIRDGHINETSFWIPGGLLSSSQLDNTDTLISPLLRLRFDLDVSKHLTALLEIGNLRLNFDSSDTRLQNQRLGDDDILVHAVQAWVRLRGWPLEGLDATLGMMEFSRDPAGWGHPLFLSSQAESPWGELPDSTVPPFPARSTNTVPQTRRDELLPAGGTITYAKDRFRASLWIFPAMVEGGALTDDESLYGLDAALDFADTVTVGAIFALLQGGTDLPDSGSQEQFVFTAGLWARAEFGIFEGFLEAYRQFGTAGFVDVDGDGSRETLRAKGFAVRLGGRLRFEADSHPWIAAEFLWVSGDESALDSEEGRFLSYENNDATPIVEANEFGLDVDNNYLALRGTGGLTVRVSSKTVELRTALTWFRLLERVPLEPDPPFGVSGTGDRLGVEWDLGLLIPWTKSLTFDAGAGFLFGSDVMARFTSGGDRTAYLISFGTRLKF